MTVEKAVVMQESGRRALFDATQRLGANYREKAGLIKSVPGLNQNDSLNGYNSSLWEMGQSALLLQYSSPANNIIIIIIIIIIIDLLY